MDFYNNTNRSQRNYRIVTIVIAVLFPWAANATDCPETITGTETCNVISQNGITWTLSTNETVGQFVTGDYYVLDDGSVTVSSVTPAASGTGEDFINGSQINPDIYPGVANRGGSHGLTYDTDQFRYRPELTVSFPLPLTAGDVLISAESKTSPTAGTTRWEGGAASSHDRLYEIAYLTIMDNTIDDYSTYFRPAPTDRDHTLYDSEDMVMSRLPIIDTSSIVLPTKAGFATLIDWAIRGSRGPWPLWVYDWTGRHLHAMQRMPNYHKDCATFMGQAHMLLLMDNAKREQLARNIVQIGIDMYHGGILGIPDTVFFMGPVLTAGLLLGEDALLNAVANGSINGSTKGVPRDFPDFYYVGETTSTVVSEIVPIGQSWRGNYQALFRNNVGASSQYEHLHPSEWHLATGFIWSHESSYRINIDSHQQIGMALFAHIAGLAEEWGNPATFDYMDYWMGMTTSEHLAECYLKAPYNAGIDCSLYHTKYTHRSGIPFINDLWDIYRAAPPVLDTCVEDSSLCISALECSTHHEEYNWCYGDTCQEAPCGMQTKFSEATGATTFPEATGATGFNQ